MNDDIFFIIATRARAWSMHFRELSFDKERPLEDFGSKDFLNRWIDFWILAARPLI